MPDVEPDLLPEAEPGRRGLRLGILVYRWASFVLTVILAAVVDLARPGLTWAALAVLAAWIGVVTWRDAWDRPEVRWIDLLLSAGFLLLAPILAEPRSLAEQPFLAAAYPLSSVLTWAAGGGLGSGLVAAGVLAVPLALSRPLNDLPYSRLTGGEITGVITMVVYYAFAAVTVGLFARTLDRAAADLRRANETAARERERAARLREREAMARTLHDSVLQSLALVHRTGRELSSRSQVAGAEVGALVELADREERALRDLLRREPEESPQGVVPLHTVLRTASSGILGVPVSISIVEPAWVEAAAAGELAAAIRQALDNVVEHAGATTVTVFGERDGADLAISVRDDGVGFEVDEARLAADGKLGIAHSMRGRIEDLGGTMRIRSAPGAGTEVEFRLPATTPASGAETRDGKEGR